MKEGGSHIHYSITLHIGNALNNIQINILTNLALKKVVKFLLYNKNLY